MDSLKRAYEQAEDLMVKFCLFEAVSRISADVDTALTECEWIEEALTELRSIAAPDHIMLVSIQEYLQIVEDYLQAEKDRIAASN